MSCVWQAAELCSTQVCCMPAGAMPWPRFCTLHGSMTVTLCNELVSIVLQDVCLISFMCAQSVANLKRHDMFLRRIAAQLSKQKHCQCADWLLQCSMPEGALETAQESVPQASQRHCQYATPAVVVRAFDGSCPIAAFSVYGTVVPHPHNSNVLMQCIAIVQCPCLHQCIACCL